MGRHTRFDLIETIDALLVAASIFITQGTALIPLMLSEEPQPQRFTPKDFGSAPRSEHKAPTPTPTPNPNIEKAIRFKAVAEEIPITYSYIETEYIGEYFVTAYSDEETWSRETASGVEVHYSDDPYEPTTVAIDPRYHRFGELLMIEGKVYICEDTGGNVKGRWADCFVETMEEVYAWDTGWKSVHSVEFVTADLTTRERQKIHERFRSYLFDRSSGSRCPRRDDY